MEEIEHKRRRLGRVLLVAALIAAFGGVLLARSDFVARALRDALVSEVRAATGFDIELARFHVNPIPFYVGFEGLRILDGDGEEVARADGMRAYIRWLPLLQKRVVFRRVVVESPDVTLTEDKIEKLSERFASHHGSPGLFRPQLSALYVIDGSFRYSSSSFDLDAEQVNLDLFLVNDPEVRFTAGVLRVRAGGLNPLSGEVRGEALYHDGALKVSQLRLDSGGSVLLASGMYRPSGTSDLDVDLTLAVHTFRQAMKLDADLSGKGTVTARGNVVFGQAAADTYVNLSLGGNFPLETLLASITGERDDDYYGMISLEGTLKGRATELEAHADATLTDGSVIGIEMDEARCGVTYSKGRLAFTDGAVRLYGGTARAEVSIGIPDVADHAVDVWFEDAASQKVFELINMDRVGFAKGTVTGEIHSHGTWFRPDGFARYRSAGQGRDLIGRVRSISGRFTTTDSGVLRLDGFLAQTARTRLAFSGGVDMESGELDLSGEVVTSGVDDLLVPHFDRLGGTASFKGTVRGTADAPLIEGTFIGEHVALDRSYVIGAVVLKVSYSMDALIVDSLDASHDSGAHRASGKVLFPRAREAFDLSDPEYDLTVQADGIALGRLLKVLSLPETVRIDGMAETSVLITGRGVAPQVAGSALLRDGSVYGVAFETAELDYAFDGNRFSVNNGTAHIHGDAGLEVDGSIALDGGFAFKARAWSLGLERLWPEYTSKYGLNGKLDVTAEGSGTLDEPRITADIDLMRASLQGRPVADSRLAARIEGSKAFVNAALMGGLLGAEASGEYGDGPDLSWRAGVDISYGRYDALVVPFLDFNNLSDDFVLGLEGRIDAEGIGRKVTASASLTRASIMYERQGFTNLSDLRFALEGTRLEIGSFKMRSAHTNVVAAGSVDIGHSWDLDLSGDSDLLPLGRFLKGIETVRGYSSYTLRVDGSWESPEISGEVAVSGAGFNITGQPQRFTDVSATVRFQGHEALVEKARARVGGGTFEASGVAYLKGFGVERFNFEVEGRNLSVWLDKGFVVKAAANVIYSGTPGEPMLSGDVRLLSAQYTKRIEWQKWLLENLRRRDAVAEVRSEGGGTGLNLRVYGDEGVRIDNNLARADLLIDVFVRGSTRDPRLFGRIEARRGKVFFRNSEFDIQRASADFLDQESLTPYLSVLAETSVKSYQITLNLEGRADRIEMTLSSSPSLDEVGILGLLAYGETGQNLQGMEEGIGAAEAAGIISGGLSGSLEETVTTLTGLDRVQLDPYVSRNSGEIAPRLTVSKRLVGEHLYVTYSYSLGDVPDEELRLEYRLSDQVSVTGGQDSYGSLGGDLKFRLRFQ